jgi:hypothetical protein
MRTAFPEAGRCRLDAQPAAHRLQRTADRPTGAFPGQRGASLNEACLASPAWHRSEPHNLRTRSHVVCCTIEAGQHGKTQISWMLRLPGMPKSKSWPRRIQTNKIERRVAYSLFLMPVL